MVIGQMVAVRAETFAIVHLLSMLAGPCALFISPLGDKRTVILTVAKVDVIGAEKRATFMHVLVHHVLVA